MTGVEVRVEGGKKEGDVVAVVGLFFEVAGAAVSILPVRDCRAAECRRMMRR